MSLRVNIDFVLLNSSLEFKLDLPLVLFFLVLDLEPKMLWRSELNTLVANRERDRFATFKSVGERLKVLDDFLARQGVFELNLSLLGALSG